MSNIPLQGAVKPSIIDSFYRFPVALSDEECDVVKGLHTLATTQDGTAGGAVNHDYRTSKINWLAFNEPNRWLYERVHSMFMSANQAMFNFDIAATEQIQLSTYEGNDSGHYDYHMDTGEQQFRRKLSMVVLLSDPKTDFTGGELMLQFSKSPTDTQLTKGMGVVFPSTMLHAVLPVRTGVRNSLVCWASGHKGFQ